MGRQARAERPSREALRAMYVDEKLTTTQIAEKLGCPAYTIKSWCARYGIRKDGQEPQRGVKRDPKRVSWLDEEGEAVSKPEHTPNTKPKQPAQIVLNPRKPRRKASPLTTPATPAQLAEAKAILANVKSEAVATDQLLLRQAVKQFRTWLQWRKEKVTP